MHKIVFSVLLALGVALAALGLLSFAYWEHAVWLALMIGLTSYPAFHSYLLDRQLDVFEPVFLFVGLYAFFYISRPIYILYTGETLSLLGFYLDRETMSLALMSSALGLLAFLIGYYRGRRRNIIGHFLQVNEVDLKRINWLATACIVIGMLAYGYVIFVLGGGVGNTFNTERTARYYIVAKNPYIANLTALIGVGILVLCFIALIKQSTRFQWRMLFLGALAYGALDIAFSGSRRGIINIVFAILMQRHYIRRTLTWHKVLPWAALLVIFSFSWLYVRTTMHEGSEAVRTRLGEVEATQTFNDVYTQGDNAIFDYLVAIISTIPMTYDYSYGSGLLRFLYFPVPRAVWPDKPENLSRIMTQRYDPMTYLSGGSAGSSMAGEFYLEFGWAGILPGALILGYLFGAGYHWLLANCQGQLVVLIYSCGMFSLVGAIVRGGVFGAATELAQTALPIFLLMRLSKMSLIVRHRWRSVEAPPRVEAM